MSDFGISTAKWYPYWKNEKFLRLEPSCIKASFYQKGNKFLLVVSNLSEDQEEEGKIVINTDALKTSSDFKLCYDALTKEDIFIKDNFIQIPLQPMRARLIWIE